jgi:hypothetical protein
MEYRLVNSVLEVDHAVNYSVEFLNSVNPPGLRKCNMEHVYVLLVFKQI